MNEQLTFEVKCNFNRISLGSWIEQLKRSDGNYDLIGMGRRTEYDAKTGAVVSDKTEPTGLTGWAPCEVVDGYKATWWARLFGAA